MSAGSSLLVGAGTVLTAAQVDEAADAGARFIVSPGFSADVVRRAQHHGLPVYPGAVTPTEIMAALELGLTTLKFFPAQHLRGPRRAEGAGRPVPAGALRPHRGHHHRQRRRVPVLAERRGSGRLLDGPGRGDRRRRHRDHPSAQRRSGRVDRAVPEGRLRCRRSRSALRRTADTRRSRSARSCSGSTRARGASAPPASFAAVGGRRRVQRRPRPAPRLRPAAPPSSPPSPTTRSAA